MQRYANLSGKSGVKAFALGAGHIDVQFEDDAVYRYTHSSTGKDEVEEMKRLAVAGRGLTSFINRNVRGNYATRLK